MKKICKAKRKNTGEWIRGYYFSMSHNDERDHMHHFFIPLGADLSKGRKIEEIQVEVDPTTVCHLLSEEYEIWEHDIVEIFGQNGFFEVEWDEDTQRFVMNGDGITVDFDNYWLHDLKRIGNKFDNPELLKGCYA